MTGENYTLKLIPANEILGTPLEVTVHYSAQLVSFYVTCTRSSDMFALALYNGYALSTSDNCCL